MIHCGDTFFLEDEDGYDSHLWIVVTPPKDGEVAIVCVTSERIHSETTVRLKVGDHPFLRHASVISYRHSRVTTVEEIEKNVKNGIAKSLAPASDALVKRAQSGLVDSDFTPNGVRYYYRNTMR
jgi:hypothetical protein